MINILAALVIYIDCVYMICGFMSVATEGEGE